MAPVYAKPFVKRQKSDAADAETIYEAAQRSTMRFVAVKSEARQAAVIVFRTRDLLMRRRTLAIIACAVTWPSSERTVSCQFVDFIANPTSHCLRQREPQTPSILEPDSRHFRMSGRSRSAACADFFKRQV
jgi:hypothetical protein